MLEPLLQVVAAQPRLAPELLRPLLHLREVVGVALDEVGDLLGGHARGVHAGQVAAPGDLDGEVVGRLPGLAERVVELEDPAGRGGGVGGQVAHLGGGHVLVLEDRVAEELHEVGDGPGVLLGRQRLQVELEDLGDLDEERRRHGAPVVLDEVEVRGGDAEPVGELHLAHALLPAQRPDLGPEHRLFAHHGRGGYAPGRRIFKVYSTSRRFCGAQMPGLTAEFLPVVDAENPVWPHARSAPTHASKARSNPATEAPGRAVLT